MKVDGFLDGIAPPFLYDNRCVLVGRYERHLEEFKATDVLRILKVSRSACPIYCQDAAEVVDQYDVVLSQFIECQLPLPIEFLSSLDDHTKRNVELVWHHYVFC